jgi:hypothetical protein
MEPVDARESAIRTRPKKGPRKKRVTYTIGFRLDEYYLSRLERGAAAYGISIHEYARQRLVELLDRQEEARLLEEAERTRAAVESLREDLAITLEAVLLNLSRADPATIRTWVDEHLRLRGE